MTKNHSGIKHPAKYSNCLLPIFKEMLSDCASVLDPFAGTGKLRLVFPDCILLEIEPEWASLAGAIVGNAIAMPFKNVCFDAICTSPTYGNRMADSFVDHQTEKKYTRNTYTHTLGRKLHKNNSGAMQWGENYRELHRKAWRECFRVLKVNGKLVLNISDHIRDKKKVDVTQWHISELEKIGFSVINSIEITTRRNGMGRNGEARVPHESIILFKKEI